MFQAVNTTREREKSVSFGRELTLSPPVFSENPFMGLNLSSDHIQPQTTNSESRTHSTVIEFQLSDLNNHRPADIENTNPIASTADEINHTPKASNTNLLEPIVPHISNEEIDFYQLDPTPEPENNLSTVESAFESYQTINSSHLSPLSSSNTSAATRSFNMPESTDTNDRQTPSKTDNDVHNLRRKSVNSTDTDNVNQPEVAKRGRGRPPKKPRSESEQDTLNDQPPAKRGRGRPPKTESTSNRITKPKIVVKRLPGRPAKLHHKASAPEIAKKTGELDYNNLSSVDLWGIKLRLTDVDGNAKAIQVEFNEILKMSADKIIFKYIELEDDEVEGADYH